MAVVAVAVVAGVVAIVASSGGSSTALPGLQTGPAPWPPEYADLRERLEALGLPAQAQMAATLHHHDLLQIFVEGRPVVVPANIGIDQEAGYLTSLHTHDASGIMHVESPTVRRFTLGQFFGVWGVRLTSTCIGGYCASGGRQLRAFVNGKPVRGAPGSIPLRQHDDIVLAYGNDAELPHPIPSSYSNSISPTCAPDC